MKFDDKLKTIKFSDITLDNSPSFRGTIVIDGKKYIVKKSRAITEHITSRLMGLMGIPTQNTSLAMLDRLVVLCEDFTPKDMSFIGSYRLFEELFPGESIDDIYDSIHLKEVFEKYFGDRAEEALSLIIYKSIFDCIVKEEDFGAGNWGILQWKDTRLAPFYDNAETMIQLIDAIDGRSFSLKKAIDYSIGEYTGPFILFKNGHLVARSGLEDITNKAIESFKESYTVERFCSYVKDTLSSLPSVFNKEEGLFLYTALVLRYLHVIENLNENELTEVAKDTYMY